MSAQVIRTMESLLSQSALPENDKKAVLKSFVTGEPMPTLSLPVSASQVFGPALLSTRTLGNLFSLIGTSQRSIPDAIAVSIGLMLLSAVRIAVGTESGSVATQVLVTSSETPPGRWNHLQTQASNDSMESLLSHSQIYTDPIVVEAITRWCVDCLVVANSHRGSS